MVGKDPGHQVSPLAQKPEALGGGVRKQGEGQGKTAPTGHARMDLAFNTFTADTVFVAPF